LARAVVAATGAAGFNVFQTNGKCSGQDVPHVHVHVIPRADGDGLGFRWKAGSYAEGEMADWQAKIRSALA
jgi:histidine triad (HIT) family protein